MRSTQLLAKQLEVARRACLEDIREWCVGPHGPGDEASGKTINSLKQRIEAALYAGCAVEAVRRAVFPEDGSNHPDLGGWAAHLEATERHGNRLQAIDSTGDALFVNWEALEKKAERPGTLPSRLLDDKKLSCGIRFLANRRVEDIDALLGKMKEGGNGSLYWYDAVQRTHWAQHPPRTLEQVRATCIEAAREHGDDWTAAVRGGQNAWYELAHGLQAQLRAAGAERSAVTAASVYGELERINRVAPVSEVVPVRTPNGITRHLSQRFLKTSRNGAPAMLNSQGEQVRPAAARQVIVLDRHGDVLLNGGGGAWWQLSSLEEMQVLPIDELPTGQAQAVQRRASRPKLPGARQAEIADETPLPGDNLFS